MAREARLYEQSGDVENFKTNRRINNLNRQVSRRHGCGFRERPAWVYGGDGVQGCWTKGVYPLRRRKMDRKSDGRDARHGETGTADGRHHKGCDYGPRIGEPRGGIPRHCKERVECKKPGSRKTRVSQGGWCVLHQQAFRPVRTQRRASKTVYGPYCELQPRSQDDSCCDSQNQKPTVDISVFREWNRPVYWHQKPERNQRAREAL